MKSPDLPPWMFPRLARTAAALGLCGSLLLPAVAWAQAGGAAPAAPAGVGAGATVAPAAQAATPARTTAPAAATTAAGATANSAESRAAQSVGGNAQELAQRRGLNGQTEFQQLVANSLGLPLPIFGQSLFYGVPSTFAPVTDVPVGSDYVLGPGDQLTVQLAGEVNQTFNLQVDRTGAIQIPQIGAVHVAGLNYGELQPFLQRTFSQLYRNFTLNVNLGALRSIQVYVVGQAERPGTYTISSLSTLLNAVFASGGPLPNGSVRNIEVKRNGKTVEHFDLYNFLLRGEKTGDIRLLPGDVIFIPFAGPQVAIAGSVEVPAIYELKGPTSVEDALKLAGGETSVAAGGGVRLERIYEHDQRSVQDVNLATEGTELLRNGDILSVSAILDRFRNAVTLRGNVANPGRYVWHPGMRISDLIPNRESLITRNYWNRQNQLGQAVQDYLPDSNISTQGTQGALQVRGTAEEQAAAAAQAGPQLQQLANNRNGNSSNNSSTGNNGSGSGSGNNSGNNNGDQNRPVLTANGAGGSVGTALTAGSTPFTARNDVILAAPDIDWSYAVIQRLNPDTLKTTLIPFNLGKLVLNGDASQNFELQPDDVVEIFSTADIRVPVDQQTRYVRLEGEFLSPGVYSVLPGETLRSLVQRAGGFSPDAYLYASEFTRESTRRVEAQRLQEYADQLDAQISSTTANATARALSATDQNAAAVSAQQARDAVARLRRTVPTGRIVLDMQPNSAGVGALPDLALEDGDRFVVPRVPSSVTVEGQVYNPNAFVFTADRHMADYLRRAGGPDREADKKREFILRADGSVVSNQYSDVKKAPVFPGDTLVVPPVIDRLGLFQRVVDLAGVVSGFGFSAATLYLLTRE